MFNRNRSKDASWLENWQMCECFHQPASCGVLSQHLYERTFLLPVWALQSTVLLVWSSPMKSRKSGLMTYLMFMMSLIQTAGHKNGSIHCHIFAALNDSTPGHIFAALNVGTHGHNFAALNVSFYETGYGLLGMVMFLQLEMTGLMVMFFATLNVSFEQTGPETKLKKQKAASIFHSIPISSLVSFKFFSSSWYNCNGWLGVKDELLTYWPLPWYNCMVDWA